MTLYTVSFPCLEPKFKQIAVPVKTYDQKEVGLQADIFFFVSSPILSIVFIFVLIMYETLTKAKKKGLRRTLLCPNTHKSFLSLLNTNKLIYNFIEALYALVKRHFEKRVLGGLGHVQYEGKRKDAQSWSSTQGSCKLKRESLRS